MLQRVVVLSLLVCLAAAGTVTIKHFSNSDCSGTPTSTDSLPANQCTQTGSSYTKITACGGSGAAIGLEAAPSGCATGTPVTLPVGTCINGTNGGKRWITCPPPPTPPTPIRNVTQKAYTGTGCSGEEADRMVALGECVYDEATAYFWMVSSCENGVVKVKRNAVFDDCSDGVDAEYTEKTCPTVDGGSVYYVCPPPVEPSSAVTIAANAASAMLLVVAASASATFL